MSGVGNSFHLTEAAGYADKAATAAEQALEALRKVEPALEDSAILGEEQAILGNIVEHLNATASYCRRYRSKLAASVRVD